ncbi:hypothetical protein PR048_017317 [Dryococelus australis]|uniref:Uncharacterized protein n=1 Tax=Dryococelus australis TaxID=614101 RepID=A0ABQ9H961_9NEOP|nr:hypothetical protein PR048_017317 [Dryococelus australis]
MRVIEVLWSGAGMKGGGNGRSPRKPADQRHRPARFSLAKVRHDHVLASKGWLHHRGSKCDLKSYLGSTQKTVAPFKFRVGLEIEIKFILNRRNWRFEISIRDQESSSTNRFFISHALLCIVFAVSSYVWGRGGVVVRIIASHLGELCSIPGGVAPGYSHAGSVPDGASGRWVFSGISRFLCPCILALLHTDLASPSSALKTSIIPVYKSFPRDVTVAAAIVDFGLGLTLLQRRPRRRLTKQICILNVPEQQTQFSPASLAVKMQSRAEWRGAKVLGVSGGGGMEGENNLLTHHSAICHPPTTTLLFSSVPRPSSLAQAAQCIPPISIFNQRRSVIHSVFTWPLRASAPRKAARAVRANNIGLAPVYPTHVANLSASSSANENVRHQVVALVSNCSVLYVTSTCLCRTWLLPSRDETVELTSQRACAAAREWSQHVQSVDTGSARPEKFAGSTAYRLDSTVLRENVQISFAHWLLAAKVENDDWACILLFVSHWLRVLQEVSNNAWTNGKCDTNSSNFDRRPSVTGRYHDVDFRELQTSCQHRRVRARRWSSRVHPEQRGANQRTSASLSPHQINRHAISHLQEEIRHKLYDEPGRKDGPVKEDFLVGTSSQGRRDAWCSESQFCERIIGYEFWRGSNSAPTSAVPARRGRLFLGSTPVKDDSTTSALLRLFPAIAKSHFPQAKDEGPNTAQPLAPYWHYSYPLAVASASSSETSSTVAVLGVEADTTTWWSSSLASRRSLGSKMAASRHRYVRAGASAPLSIEHEVMHWVVGRSSKCGPQMYRRLCRCCEER